MASSRFVSSFAVIGFVGLSLACSSSSSDNPGKGGGGSGGSVSGGGTGGSSASGGTGGNGATDGGGGTAPNCETGPGFPSSDPSHLVNTVSATILDLDGQPAAKTLAQVCGIDICINGSTDDKGNIVTCDPKTSVCALGIDPKLEEKKPALKYGDGLGYAKFAFQMPTDTSDYALGTHTTVKLPDISTGVDFVPGGDTTSGNITVTMPAGGIAKVDKLTFDTPDVQKFRAAEIPAAKAPDAVDKSQNFEILVATTPIETEFCPRAKLTVPNTPNWPAGTAVEFWVHGVEQDEAWAPYAGWAKMSDGTVSADGKTVSTEGGQGIAILNVFGVKKK